MYIDPMGPLITPRPSRDDLHDHPRSDGLSSTTDEHPSHLLVLRCGLQRDARRSRGALCRSERDLHGRGGAFLQYPDGKSVRARRKEFEI
jgi:hypothetical protein